MEKSVKVLSSYPCMAEAVRAAYRAGEDDETLEPLIRADRQGRPVGRIGAGHYVIFYDLRGEREIELTESFTAPNFDRFPTLGRRVHFVTMIQYAPHLDVRVAFPPLGPVRDGLCETVSRHGRRQVKIVESEKAVHLRFFLNGKVEEPFPGEEWIFPETRKDIARFDEAPEMSLGQVADAAIARLQGDRDDLIVVNFANVDVLGHLENEAAIRRAVEAVDAHIGRLLAAARQAGVIALITADHGTVEEWLYPEGTINTGHTANPVPCILVDPTLPAGSEVTLRPAGELADVAPTVLHLLGLPPPAAMTGRSLLQHDPPWPAGQRRRVLLLIADGWGWREERQGNLIAQAHTPVMDRLQAECPTTRLQSWGEAVGLPPGTVGNSEVGHLHLGAGRRIPSDRLRIQQALEDGSFFQNEAFLGAMRGARREGVPLHLLGIISFFSSHGTIDYALHLLRLAAREGLREVYVHGLLGRRGERPDSGAHYVERIEAEARRLGVGQVASLIGRFWALDREGNWDRIEKTYRALVYGEGRRVQLREPEGRQETL